MDNNQTQPKGYIFYYTIYTGNRSRTYTSAHKQESTARRNLRKQLRKAGYSITDHKDSFTYITKANHQVTKFTANY